MNNAMAWFLIGIIIGMCLLGFPLIKSGGGFIPKLEACLKTMKQLDEDVVALNERFETHKHKFLTGEVVYDE